MTADARTELWQERMSSLQGSIIVSSLLQVVIGFTGITLLAQNHLNLIISYIIKLRVLGLNQNTTERSDQDQAENLNLKNIC